MIRRFLRWARRLLSLPPRPQQAARPDPPGRLLHLAEGFTRSSCGLMSSPSVWITVEVKYVTCGPCRVIGNRRAMLRASRVR